MATILSDLTDLRRRIDMIDDQMHDLLMERAEIVAQVAASKRGGDVAFYQPAREAQILRRLAARHHGILPVAPVLRIWREMLAATVRLETPFTVAVFVPAQSQGSWDLARDHYGSHTPISACRSSREVIRAVIEGNATVGILPIPEEGEPDPWWPRLGSQNGDAPRVIARLPFGIRGNARSDHTDAFAIGRSTQQETGADRTLFVTQSVINTSRARLLELLAAVDLNGIVLASYEEAQCTLHLIDLEGFIPTSDPRISRFYKQFGSAQYRLLSFGGYASPLPEVGLEPAAAKG
ncbi:MAG: chorismate mutase [Alphaproteobacteria bacterium]|nr:chorismate mutase [Alphaproteobacteria bacterium]